MWIKERGIHFKAKEEVSENTMGIIYFRWNNTESCKSEQQHYPEVWEWQFYNKIIVSTDTRHRATAGYPKGVLVRVQYQQRPQTTPMTHCNDNLQVTLYELKDNLCDSLCHTSTAMINFFSAVFLFLCFKFYLGRGCKGRGQK